MIRALNKILKTTKMIVVVLVPLIILMNCVFESKSEGAKGKYDEFDSGIIINDCGPTDAGVVRIILTKNEFQCGNSILSAENIHSYLQLDDVNDIKKGMVLEPHKSSGINESNTLFYCDSTLKNCSLIGSPQLTIFEINDSIVIGNMTIDEKVGVSRFEITKCQNDRPMCG